MKIIFKKKYHKLMARHTGIDIKLVSQFLDNFIMMIAGGKWTLVICRQYSNEEKKDFISFYRITGEALNELYDKDKKDVSRDAH